ncbi:hypothetical protein LZ575_12430 [Antarcticibacterium sp. 1MA-6-2]|uniref:HYC_CC_PP family protein n=1 Tax=Antarcticibacterium sp. 1MA-6-2 TaxID=2908210 RepID=UPI001F3925B8|nr:hypothetical protein [Antarcticibacterium sp. 1MA-6-2]UJH89820.1 hypothetical protein LZ575_12430 [Antarcticibacterium sp. 1MA-6-2]
MRKKFQKAISTLLALLVLVSTFSFTVDKHFCGSILVDLAVFSEAETCGMEMDFEMGIAEDSCCTNEKTAVEGQDELKISFNSLDLDQQIFLTSFTHTFLNLFEGASLEVIPFKDYTPPLLVTDIQVLDQVFLI